ncbi:unnamed protein product [Effrenium voratum]|uniref:Spondin-like TSP1 domain-containing protein n=1 Tax=Effrenium voratum TaxID=2562239 RepID=A0AA36HKI1_9DINO|nr:unnamed protein product [Effrenium voratum]
MTSSAPEEEDDGTTQATTRSTTARPATTQTRTTSQVPSTTQSGDVNCQWETWADWSACQFSCGGGQSMRTRKVKVMAQGKGAACENGDKETRDCNYNPCPVDCAWDEWSPWGTCSATCGMGTKVKTRAQKRSEQYGGNACSGNSSAAAECQDKVCPVDCKWSDWGDWEGCSKSCGDGQRSRYRSFAQIKNAVGKECIGQNLQTEGCGMNACPVDCVMEDWQPWEPCDVTCGTGATRRARKALTLPAFGGEKCGSVSENKTCDNGVCPVHCQLSDWTQWAECSISCTSDGTPGTTKRFRTVATQKNFLGDDCVGELEQSTSCSKEQCPINCDMSDWSQWSDCSTSCGPGVVGRQRDIASAAQYGGEECTNETYEEKYCSRDTCPVDCQWSDWQDWHACSVSCGTGSSYRMRLIQTPMLHGGRDCEGDYRQSRDCNPAFCPLHCEWGDWAQWGECSASCGDGSAQRGREVKVRADYGGTPCDGDSYGSKNCSNMACPVDCAWSDWAPWGTCSSSCGTGLQARKRENSEARNGGADCYGNATESTSCVDLPPCPVDCEWDDWTQWAGCTVSCGAGFQRRSRIRKLYEKDGGHTCFGTEDDEQVCNLDPCPVDCALGDWTRWSDCSVSCGPAGQQTRSRAIVRHGSLGGVPCNTSNLTASTKCEDVPCPVHCEWATWGQWSKCSKECNGGLTSRQRSENISAAHGGRKCEGSAAEEMVCNPHGCPVDCKFEDWAEWGGCSKSCGSGNRTAGRVLITPAQWGGTPCDGGIEKMELCNEQPCPLDCTWSDWSHLSLCSQTCGGGVMTRTRSPNSEMYGGKACIGHELESVPCNTQGCAQDCQWAQWTEWTGCSKECGGGSIKRVRDVLVKRAFGGEPCIGPGVEEAGCNFDVCPTHCKWSDWEQWSPCPASCNGGTRSKSRTRVTEAANGGKACEGNRTEVAKCNTDPCPVDCSFELWQEWGDCSASCGQGTRFRTRVKKAELYGGAACQDLMWEVGQCSNPDEVNCPSSTSTTTTLALLKLPEGQLAWSHLHNVWEPQASRGTLGIPSPEELTKTFSESKNPSYPGKAYKPVIPCPDDDMNKTLEAYETIKSKPDAASRLNISEAVAVKAIDDIIANLTGKAPPGSKEIADRIAQAGIGANTDVAEMRNLTGSDLPFGKAADNISELAKTAGAAPDTPATMKNFTDAFESRPDKQKDGRDVVAEVAGDLGLDVMEADEFVGNPNVSVIMEKAIASLCGALPADVKVDVTIPQAMLLSQVQKRLKGNVNVAYMVEVYKQDASKGQATKLASQISNSDINTVTSEVRRQVAAVGLTFTLRAVSLSVTVLPVTTDGNIDVTTGEDGNASVEDAMPTAVVDGKAKAPKDANAMVETAQKQSKATARLHHQSAQVTVKKDQDEVPGSQPAQKSGAGGRIMAAAILASAFNLIFCVAV